MSRITRAAFLLLATFGIGFALRTALPARAHAECECFLDSVYDLVRVDSPSGGDTAAEQASFVAAGARQISVQGDKEYEYRLTYKAIIYTDEGEKVVFRIAQQEEP